MVTEEVVSITLINLYYIQGFSAEDGSVMVIGAADSTAMIQPESVYASDVELSTCRGRF